MEKNIVISLSNQIKNNKGDEAWSEIALKEPVLIQVQQFYEEQAKNGALAGMSLLIHLLSGIPREVINRLPFTDYKKAEAYLLDFLEYSPRDGKNS